MRTTIHVFSSRPSSFSNLRTYSYLASVSWQLADLLSAPIDSRSCYPTRSPSCRYLLAVRHLIPCRLRYGLLQLGTDTLHSPGEIDKKVTDASVSLSAARESVCAVMKAEESPGPRLTALQRSQKTVFQVGRRSCSYGELWQASIAD